MADSTNLILQCTLLLSERKIKAKEDEEIVVAKRKFDFNLICLEFSAYVRTLKHAK